MSMNPYRTRPGFPARVTHAERCLKLLAEGRDGRTENGETYSVASDRKFDSCFEMYDGDAVVWELMRRAKIDSVLLRGIEKSCGNATALQHWYRIAGYQGQQLRLVCRPCLNGLAVETAEMPSFYLRFR